MMEGGEMGKEWNEGSSAGRWDPAGYGPKGPAVQRGIEQTVADMVRHGNCNPHSFGPSQEGWGRARPKPEWNKTFERWLEFSYSDPLPDGAVGEWMADAKKRPRDFEGVTDALDLRDDHGVASDLAYEIWAKYEMWTRRWWR